MKKNIGAADRSIRLILAAIFASLYVGKLATGGIGITLVVMSVILAITAFVNSCPLYTLLGINTCSIKNK